MAVQKEHELGSSYYTAVYFCVSVLLAMLVGLLFYVLCSRRYRLNWYERDQLDKVETRQGHSQISIVTGSVSDVAESLRESINRTPTSQGPSTSGTLTVGIGNGTKSKCIRSQSSGRLESTSSQESGHFWVPPSLQRQASVCQSDVPTDLSGDDISLPGTPNTPLNIKLSPFAVPNANSASGLITDKAVSPGQLVKYVQPASTTSASILRPKVTSMYSRLDHTKINMAMYNKEGTPKQSPEESPRGSVHFAVSYNREFSILCVHLIQVVDLLPREFSGTADPYAKIRLLPDRKTYRQSSIHRKTLNPTFDEEFVFDLPENATSERVVEILIFDYDEYSRHHCLGYVQLPLDGLDLQEKTAIWKPIAICDEAIDQPELGQIMFSLGYLPSAERLTVVVMKARDLKAVDDTKKTSDPYVKVSLLQEGKRLKKKKTSTQRGTVNPVFNEALTFNVSKETLKSVSFEFTVVNDNKLAQKNDVLGKVIVGPDSHTDQSTHIQSMIASKTAVAMWHNLEPPEVAPVNS